jgi:hypothetical protein
VDGAWPYFYNTTSYTLASGCANPDQDVEGSWCPIDQASCGRSAGSFRSNSTMVAFDYCLSQVAPYSARWAGSGEGGRGERGRG